MTWAHVAVVLAGLAGGLLPADAVAQGAPVMPSSVPSDAQVTVDVVRASTPAAPHLDPRLGSWASLLSKMPFRAYDLVGQTRWRLHDRQHQDLTLPDGRVVSLTLGGHGPSEAQVIVTTRRAGAEPVETVLRIARDRAFLYVLRTAPDAAFLLRIDVHY